MSASLTLTWAQHQAIKAHVLPADGKEAVAFALCGQAVSETRTRLVVRRVIPLPYEKCSVRAPDQVTWPTDWLVPLLNEAADTGMALVKFHGHYDFPEFSGIDDISDRTLFPSVYDWAGNQSNASAIILADDSVFGRIVTADAEFEPFESVNSIGADLRFWRPYRSVETPEYALRIAQAFGDQTYKLLQSLRVGVVGASGTGSGVIEQLARNCVGTLIIVDPDIVEPKNLNRIWNATSRDAAAKTPKVLVAARAIESMKLGTHVVPMQCDLFNPEAIKEIASCDVVFGCVDTIDGRHLLNRLATFYDVAYIDMGVRIDADGNGGVDQVAASVHYLQPGGASLLSRHVFDLEQVRAAGIRRTDPGGFERLRKEGYIRGAPVDRPAVIQLNTLAASLAVNELLARLHPYRLDSNDDFAVQRVSLSHGIFEHESEGAPCSVLSRHLGRGDVSPLLDMPELSVRK